MELKIKKKTIEFESKSIYIIIIDFGISFYVWIGKYPNLEFLCVTFPVSVSYGRKYFLPINIKFQEQ